jgi:hypothetical protein
MPAIKNEEKNVEMSDNDKFLLTDRAWWMEENNSSNSKNFRRNPLSGYLRAGGFGNSYWINRSKSPGKNKIFNLENCNKFHSRHGPKIRRPNDNLWRPAMKKRESLMQKPEDYCYFNDFIHDEYKIWKDLSWGKQIYCELMFQFVGFLLGGNSVDFHFQLNAQRFSIVWRTGNNWARSSLTLGGARYLSTGMK